LVESLPRQEMNSYGPAAMKSEIQSIELFSRYRKAESLAGAQAIAHAY
jgi:hypothetical protein